MKIIINELEKTTIINKSKFISIVKKIMTKNEAEDFLNTLKDKYPDATHICYAYALPNIEKYSDDNEPTGTAGMPILEVLRKNNVNYTMAVVIRYFSGVKLGSNGLIRAYSGCISGLINNNIKDIEQGYLISITMDYSDIDYLEYLLKDDIIIKKDYQDKINMEVIVKKKTLEKLSNVSYKILDEKII